MKFDKFRDKFNKYFAVFLTLVMYVAVLAAAVFGGGLAVIYWGKNTLAVIIGIFMCIVFSALFIFLLINYDYVFDL
ncbi:MAG: hypothetical protein [Caudoviricetes sp.]|nr:MAG: hypothetical protein [Caudoviricetes sp.]